MNTDMFKIKVGPPGAPHESTYSDFKIRVEGVDDSNEVFASLSGPGRPGVFDKPVRYPDIDDFTSRLMEMARAAQGHF